jgi:hypothetical protein
MAAKLTRNVGVLLQELTAKSSPVETISPIFGTQALKNTGNFTFL